MKSRSDWPQPPPHNRPPHYPQLQRTRYTSPAGIPAVCVLYPANSNIGSTCIMIGKFIFIIRAIGCRQNTLVGATLKSIDNLETVVTYVTRGHRIIEAKDVDEYIFVDDTDYDN